MNKEERLMMSEEEVRQRAKELLNLPKEHLITQYMFLQQENEQLKNKIDKAIEYIKERTEFNQYSEVYPSVLDAREVKEILKILKGE